MKPRREAATPGEKLRYAALASMPCAACRKLGFYGTVCGPTEIHHLTDGGRRISNYHTIPLGRYHHRAQLPVGCKTTSEAIERFGPSLETSKRDFEARFGTELELLKETDRLLGTNTNVELA